MGRKVIRFKVVPNPPRVPSSPNNTNIEANVSLGLSTRKIV